MKAGLGSGKDNSNVMFGGGKEDKNEKLIKLTKALSHTVKLCIISVQHTIYHCRPPAHLPVGVTDTWGRCCIDM